MGCGCAGRRTSCSTVTFARRILLSLSLENRANGADIIICVAFRLFHFISFVIVFSQTKKKMKDERTRREKKMCHVQTDRSCAFKGGDNGK